MADREEILDLDLPMPNLYRLVHDPAFSSQMTNRIMARMEQEIRESMATPPERVSSELLTACDELTRRLDAIYTELSEWIRQQLNEISELERQQLNAANTVNNDLRRHLNAANTVIENLQQPRYCITCLSCDPCVLLPCKHVCVCETCFPQLNGRCPVCRRAVNSIMKVYFP